jgi:ectoine hydroxylase
MTATHPLQPEASPESGRDPYRSREEDAERIVSRCDPVIWGGSEGPLTDAQLTSFERNGYLVAEGLLADELPELQAEAERIRSDSSVWPPEELISEPDNGALRSAFRIHTRSPVYERLAASLSLTEIASQILGSRVYVHQSRINFKSGLDGREFFWHSDFETWHMEDGMPRMRAVSASVMLSDNTAANGPLMIIAGSHGCYVRCAGHTPTDHYKRSLKKQEYGVPSADALGTLAANGSVDAMIAPAGSVVFFDCNAMHGSPGNLSPLPRHNVFLVFNSVENRLLAPFGGMTPRPGFLAER